MFQIFKKYKLFSFLLFFNIFLFICYNAFYFMYNHEHDYEIEHYYILIYIINLTLLLRAFIFIKTNDFLLKLRYVIPFILTYFSTVIVFGEYSLHIKSQSYNKLSYPYNINYITSFFTEENNNQYDKLKKIEEVTLYSIDKNISLNDFFCDRKNNISSPFTILDAKGINTNKNIYTRLPEHFKIELPNIKSGKIDEINIYSNNNKKEYIFYSSKDKNYNIHSSKLYINRKHLLTGEINYKYDNIFYKAIFLNNYIYIIETNQYYYISYQIPSNQNIGWCATGYDEYFTVSFDMGEQNKRMKNSPVGKRNEDIITQCNIFNKKPMISLK